ncbi:hypothetical protein BX666DRAFT_1882578 [Dichotomocladium elegans]|nr:hypothetical protein BX666DRAFT_1882578 [Dichotomocladium elegans]
MEDKSSYVVTKHNIFVREEGSTAITLVPGVGSSLYPFRRGLKHGALAFADVGLVSHKNITSEWPESRLACGDRRTVLAKLVDWQEKSTDDQQDASTLRKLDHVVMRHYAPDHKVLEEKEVIVVTEFGYSMFRNKYYLCLTLEDGRRVCCGNGLETIASSMLSNGQHFHVQILRHKIVKGTHDLECKLVQ